MAVFAFIIIFFCPIITKLDKKINKLKQKTALHGMMSIAFFFSPWTKKKTVVFQSPVLSVLQVGISCC